MANKTLLAFVFVIPLLGAGQNPGDQECYTCKPAFVEAGPGFGLGGCPSSCAVTSCSGSSTSIVWGGTCDKNVADKDCVFPAGKTYTGVSQNDQCTVNASITCPSGKHACIVVVTQTTLVVPDCETQSRTVLCVKQPCDCTEGEGPWVDPD